MDRGAWQDTVHGVTESQTRLKQLSANAKHVISTVAQCQVERFITGPFCSQGLFAGCGNIQNVARAPFAP